MLGDSNQKSGAGWGELIQSAARKNNYTRFSELSNLQKLQSGVDRVKQVSKGISKSEQAKTLLEKHWLEATDPKHRYGNGTQVYYQFWKNSNTSQDFWKWIDDVDGEGHTLDLEEFPRKKFDSYIVKYLGEEERKAYAVEVREGKFYYIQTGKQVNTLEEIANSDEQGKFIFVISPDKIMYCGPKIRGHFHHSSFLSGGTTIGAGNLQIENGVLTTIKPHSGHYMPSAQEFANLLQIFKDWGVDMAGVSIGQIKPPKKKFVYKKFFKKYTKHLKTELHATDQQVNQLMRVFKSEIDLKSAEQLNTEEDQQEEQEPEFQIPLDFLQSDNNIPKFLRKGVNEIGQQYFDRVENFLYLLENQELVYIISRIDPSREDMAPFLNMVSSVMKEKNDKFYGRLQ